MGVKCTCVPQGLATSGLGTCSVEEFWGLRGSARPTHPMGAAPSGLLGTEGQVLGHGVQSRALNPAPPFLQSKTVGRSFWDLDARG